MSKLKDLAMFLSSHARGQGKTHNLALATKQVGGTLLVRDGMEAKRIQKEYGINALIYTAEMRGRHMGPTYVDPDAVAQIMFEYEDRLSRAKALLESAEPMVDAHYNDPLSVYESLAESWLKNYQELRKG